MIYQMLKLKFQNSWVRGQVCCCVASALFTILCNTNTPIALVNFFPSSCKSKQQTKQTKTSLHRSTCFSKRVHTLKLRSVGGTTLVQC